jgi:tripartite-type tricarboxylate transporter receptor subunit TctC
LENIALMITRRGFVAGLSASGAFPHVAHAAWPERPITMLHGFAPGGGADANARIAAEGLGKVLGQTVLVESKSGAGTTLASAQLVRAAPDGYTIALVATSYCASAAFYKKLPYRPIEDISAVGLLSEAPYVIATYAEHPARSLPQMLDMARKPDRSISYGTPGVGSGNHLATELLAQLAGVKLTHVPFRGGAQAVIEVLAQRIDFMIDPPLSMIEHLKSGKFRGLAVSTTKRFPGLPEIPTVQESGISNFDVAAWYALVAPVATPDPVIQRLNAATGEALATPAVRDRLIELGAVPKSSSQKELADLIAADIRRWTDVIEKAGIERI